MKLFALASLVLMAALVVSCAPSIPQKDVDAAAAAFADVKTAQADVFAPDAFKAASDANDALAANLAAKDYGKTKDLAQAVIDASAKAKDAAAAGLDAAKADVAKMVTDVPALAATVKKELDKAAKAKKKAKVDVTKAQADYAAAAKDLTDGQAAATAGNVADAKTKLTSASTAFSALQKELEDAGYKA